MANQNRQQNRRSPLNRAIYVHTVERANLQFSHCWDFDHDVITFHLEDGGEIASWNYHTRIFAMGAERSPITLVTFEEAMKLLNRIAKTKMGYVLAGDDFWLPTHTPA